MLLVWAFPSWAGDRLEPNLLRFSLGLTGSAAGTTGFSSQAADADFATRKIGQPRSAADDRVLGARGLSLVSPRTATAGIAGRHDSAPHAPETGDRQGGLALSGSWHAYGDASDGHFVVGGRYQVNMPEALDQLSVLGGAESRRTDNIYRLGTALTRSGQATGPALTAKDSETEHRVSGVFLGLAVNESISLGMSRELDFNGDGVSLPAQYGFAAAMEFGSGSTVAGSIGDIGGGDPVFGLALRLEF